MALFNIGGNNTEKEMIKLKNKEIDTQTEGKVITAAAVAEREFTDEGREDLLKWQQDLRDEIVRLTMTLKSMYQNEDGKWHNKTYTVKEKQKNGKYVIVNYEMRPIINEFGIHMIEQEITPLMNRNIIMSNLNEDQILLLLKDTSNTIVNNLADNYDLYEVKFTDMSHIMRLVKNVIIPAPFRALNNGERIHQRTINKRIEAYSERGNKEDGNKRMFGIFGG